MSQESNEVTRILGELKDSPEAQERLLPHVYSQLRQIADRRMSRERSDHTLQATALVHEAFMRLVGDRGVSWEGKSCFYAAASEAMRRILVDHARRRGARRRGGDASRVPLGLVDLAVDQDPTYTLAFEDALQKLEKEDPRAAQVVKLRFFAGLEVEETAAAMGVSPRTVYREWTFARARLFQLLGETGEALPDEKSGDEKPVDEKPGAETPE